MNGFRHSCLVPSLVLAAILAWSQSATNTLKAETPSNESKATVEGLVRDIACPIQNLEATATHLSMKCLQACARKRSPLVILTKDGELYLPISDKMPDEDQRQKLTPFPGKYVRVRGTVYERQGMHAIAINQIEELKNVDLTIDDK
jgi:hypothetical protein